MEDFVETHLCEVRVSYMVGPVYIICVIQHVFPGLDLYYADTAQPLTTAGEELDDLYDLDHDLICPRCGML